MLIQAECRRRSARNKAIQHAINLNFKAPRFSRAVFFDDLLEPGPTELRRCRT